MGPNKCAAAGGKQIYASDHAARKAIHGIENNNAHGQEPLHVYRCPDDASHYHVGHTARYGRIDKAAPGRKTPPKRRPVKRRTKTTRRGEGRADRGVNRPAFTAAEWDAATMTLWHRSLGRCEYGGCPITENAERHHRQRRAVGGDRYSNLVLLCPKHHAHIHANPELARTLGFIVPANDTPTPDPATVPVMIDGRRWLLRDDGTKTPQP